MSLNKICFFDNVSAIKVSDVISVENSEYLQLDITGTADKFKILIYAQVVTDGEFLPLGAIGNNDFKIYDTIETNGFYRVSTRGVLNVKLNLIEIESGSLNCFGSLSLRRDISDWEETDETKLGFIKNKPIILTEENIKEIINENGGGKSPYIGENGNWYEWDNETKTFVDTGIQVESSSIIDVTELPTTNIKRDILYKLMVCKVVYNKFIFDEDSSFVCYCVNGLPDEGLVITDENRSFINLYYNIQDETVSGYITNDLSIALGVPVGWYTIDMIAQAFGETYNGIIYNSNDAIEDGFYILMTSSLYYYTDKWVKVLNTIGQNGNSYSAEIFNDYDNNQASGDYSHAEGYSSKASGDYSHVEGYKNLAEGEASHAEGVNNAARGNFSHVEGSDNAADGFCSHAEGYYTKSNGMYSHSEGTGTIASSYSQHVQGKYNAEDSEDIYAHIVGNGTHNAPSNAHVLDWDGNAYFAGDVFVGNANETDKAKKLATEEYVDSKMEDERISTLSNQVVGLNEIIPDGAITSVCDFTFIPKTLLACYNVYGDGRKYWRPNNQFYGTEVPLLTTRGIISIVDSNDNVKYEKELGELINWNGVSDILTNEGLTRNWSKRFYITRPADVVESISISETATTSSPNSVLTWYFTESDFEDIGLPIKQLDIPFIASAFTPVTGEALMTTARTYAEPAIGSFSYNESENRYEFKARLRQYVDAAFYEHSKTYFCYQLAEPIKDNSLLFAMGISAGDKVQFEQENSIQEYIDAKTIFGSLTAYISDTDVTPSVEITVPMNLIEAHSNTENIVRILNMASSEIELPPIIIDPSEPNGREDSEPVKIGLNELAPNDVIPSICNFRLIPKTVNATMSLWDDSDCWFQDKDIASNAKAPYILNGIEIPLITTRGELLIKNAEGNIEYRKSIPELINYEDVSDELYNDSIIKKWSKKFYINRPPDIVNSDSATFAWKFKINEFEEIGLPKQKEKIPFISPIFCGADANTVDNTAITSNALPVAAYFSYHEDADEKYYLLKCRVRYYHENYGKRFYEWTPSYFCYELNDENIITDSMISCYIDKGYSVEYKQDDFWYTNIPTDNNMCDSFNEFWENYARKRKYCPVFPSYNTTLWTRDNSVADREDQKNINSFPIEYYTTPEVEFTVPKSIVSSLQGMEQVAKELSKEKSFETSVDINDYQWIGDGNGSTDYTEKLQKKIDEVFYQGGGNVYLGSGTYIISSALVVGSNVRIIGNGATVIEQVSDNTHGIMLNGNHIHLQDLTIKLSGACAELTGCIFANCDNHVNNTDYDNNYPSNYHVYHCCAQNVQLKGKYSMAYDESQGYHIPDGMLDYKGVGILSRPMYFCFFNGDNVFATNLYAGVYGGGNSSNYNIFVMDSRIAAYIRGGLNTYEIHGHTYYAVNKNNETFSMTDYIAYCECSENNIISIGFYDAQHTISNIYFDGLSFSNSYMISPNATGYFNSPVTGGSITSRENHSNVIDYGRCNVEVLQPEHTPYAVGSRIFTISGLTETNELNGAMENALAGAGVWGNITSNANWEEKGISLSQICRYPQDGNTSNGNRLGSIVSSTSPSEELPLEVIIDISNRPIRAAETFWIQFDDRYVAEEFTIYLDTNNDGTFNPMRHVTNNIQSVWYHVNHQKSSRYIYKIKLSFTKALRIENLKYRGASYVQETMDYNPSFLVGIVNFGASGMEPFGRAFLGECGGNLYGNLEMNNESTIKNLPTPIEDGDAVNKAYVDSLSIVNPDWNQNDSTQRDYIKNRPFYKEENVPVDYLSVTFEDGQEEITLDGKIGLEVGKTYTFEYVKTDGTVVNSEISTEAEYDSGLEDIFIFNSNGSITIDDGMNENWESADACWICVPTHRTWNTLRIHGIPGTDTIIHKIPQEYLDLTGLGEQSDWTETDINSPSYIKNKPTDLATLTDVDTKIAAMVDSAPETLNTLNELAKALGEDPNFAATVVAMLSDKLNINAGYDNEGKYLKVVNGKATWVNIPNAEEVSF